MLLIRYMILKTIMTDVKTQIFTREQLIQVTRTTYEQTKKEYSKLAKDNKSLYKLSNAEDGVLLNEPETPENNSVK